MIEAAILSLLQADAGVAVHFGPSAARVWTEHVPDGQDMPHCAFTRGYDEPISGIREDTGWNRALLDFEVHGSTRRQAREAAKALRDALRRFHGTAAGVTIDDILWRSSQDRFESDRAGSSVVELSMEIFFKE